MTGKPRERRNCDVSEMHPYEAALILHPATPEEEQGPLLDKIKQFVVAGGGEVTWNFLDGHSTYINNGKPTALPNANVRVGEARAETFGTATWKIDPTLTLEAGSRLCSAVCSCGSQSCVTSSARRRAQ